MKQLSPLSQYFRLLRLFFKATFSLKGRESGNKKKTTRRIGLGILIGFSVLILVLVLFAAFFAVFSVADMAMATSLLGMMILLLQLTGALFALRITFGLFGGARDLPFLLSLPIGSRTLFAARLTTAYGNELLIQAGFLTPVIVAFLLIYGSAVSWVFSLIFLLLSPVLPLCVASLVSLVVARFTRRMKRREMLTSVLGVLLFGALMAGFQFLNARVNSGLSRQEIEGLLKSAGALTDSATKLFPPAGWVANAIAQPLSIHALGLLGFVLICAVSIGALVMLGGRLYRKGSIGQGEAPTSGKRGAIKARQQSSFLALAKREWRGIMRSPTYAINTMTGIIMGPIMLLMPYFMSDMKELIGYASGNVIFFVLLGLLGFFCCLDPAASTLISREGKCIYLAKMIPVSPARQVLAKLFVAQCVVTAGMLLVVLIAPLLYPISYGMSMLAFVFAFFASLPSLFISALPDLKKPRLDWSSEQQAMKQNFNSLWGMLLSLLFIVPQIVIVALLWRNIALACAASVLFSLAVTAVLIARLPKITQKCFDRY